MAPKDHISEQVDKAIEFGDETLIRRLLMVVRKKSLVMLRLTHLRRLEKQRKILDSGLGWAQIKCIFVKRL